MIIKMESEFQTHRRPFCTPKPNADLCMRVDLPLDREKIVENQAGAPGRRAVVDRWSRAAGICRNMP